MNKLVQDAQINLLVSFQTAGIKLKLVNAIHFVSALEAKCDVFVTADTKFKSSAAMRVVRIGGVD